jgi:hypothetical protein
MAEQNMNVVATAGPPQSHWRLGRYGAIEVIFDRSEFEAAENLFITAKTKELNVHASTHTLDGYHYVTLLNTESARNLVRESGVKFATEMPDHDGILTTKLDDRFHTTSKVKIGGAVGAGLTLAYAVKEMQPALAQGNLAGAATVALQITEETIISGACLSTAAMTALPALEVPLPHVGVPLYLGAVYAGYVACTQAVDVSKSLIKSAEQILFESQVITNAKNNGVDPTIALQAARVLHENPSLTSQLTANKGYEPGHH